MWRVCHVSTTSADNWSRATSWRFWGRWKVLRSTSSQTLKKRKRHIYKLLGLYPSFFKAHAGWLTGDSRWLLCSKIVIKQAHKWKLVLRKKMRPKSFFFFLIGCQLSLVQTNRVTLLWKFITKKKEIVQKWVNILKDSDEAKNSRIDCSIVGQHKAGGKNNTMLLLFSR